MSPAEKLGRRICWLGFSGRRGLGTTEARYWASLPEVTRQTYIQEAYRFVWLQKRIYQSISSSNVLHEAAHQIERERAELRSAA